MNVNNLLGPSLVLVGGQELLELALVILVKGLQVLDLVLVGLLLARSLLLILLDNVDDFLLQPLNLIFKFVISLSQLGDIGLHFIFLLLGHESFPHAVSDA